MRRTRSLEKGVSNHRREGDLGPVYGFQWRHFGAEYVDCDAGYEEKEVDQLQEVPGKIKEEPTDRRIISIAWNDAGMSHAIRRPPCSVRPTNTRYVPDGPPTMPFPVPILRSSPAPRLTR